MSIIWPDETGIVSGATPKKIANPNIGAAVKTISSLKTSFYQTEDMLQTIVIIEDSDGAISMGVARAGRTDIEKRRVTSQGGIDVAEGRAWKARETKIPLIDKNYLRGVYMKRIGWVK